MSDRDAFASDNSGFFGQGGMELTRIENFLAAV